MKVDLYPERPLPSPAGTVTVTRVWAATPVRGVNTAVSPSRCQVPATAGDSRGSAAVAGSGSLKVTVMLPALSTPRLPSAGVTDSRRGGRGGCGGASLTATWCPVFPGDAWAWWLFTAT